MPQLLISLCFPHSCQNIDFGIKTLKTCFILQKYGKGWGDIDPNELILTFVGLQVC